MLFEAQLDLGLQSSKCVDLLLGIAMQPGNLKETETNKNLCG